MRRTPLGENGRSGWITQAELLNLPKNVQFPDDPAKREGTQIHRHPDVLGIDDIKEMSLERRLLESSRY